MQSLANILFLAAESHKCRNGEKDIAVEHPLPSKKALSSRRRHNTFPFNPSSRISLRSEPVTGTSWTMMSSLAFYALAAAIAMLVVASAQGSEMDALSEEEVTSGQH